MAFIQPCFIRKNTPELIAKLEKIGYKRDCCFEGNLPFIYIGDYSDCGLGPLYSEANYGAPILFSTNFKRIDCKENEELFLALAALRNDSDYMQWFVVPKTHTKQLSGYFGQIVGMDGHYKEIVGYEWYRHENKDNTLTERLNAMFQMEVDDIEFLPHKATVEEIIEHFSNCLLYKEE